MWDLCGESDIAMDFLQVVHSPVTVLLIINHPINDSSESWHWLTTNWTDTKCWAQICIYAGENLDWRFLHVETILTADEFPLCLGTVVTALYESPSPVCEVTVCLCAQMVSYYSLSCSAAHAESYHVCLSAWAHQSTTVEAVYCTTWPLHH
jgi:hypothetical protein